MNGGLFNVHSQCNFHAGVPLNIHSLYIRACLNYGHKHFNMECVVLLTPNLTG